MSSSAAAVLPAIPSLVVPTESAVTVETAPVVKSEDYYPITDSKNVEKFVRDYFAETPILAEIARCESTFRHYDKKTGQVLKGKVDSRDTGVMQINLYYHADTAEKLGLNLHDVDDNVAYAKYLYEKQGAKPWMSSSACWSKDHGTEIAKR